MLDPVGTDGGCGVREKIIHSWHKARRSGWNREGSPQEYGKRKRRREQDKRREVKGSSCDDLLAGRGRRRPGRTDHGKEERPSEDGAGPGEETNVLDAAN